MRISRIPFNLLWLAALPFSSCVFENEPPQSHTPEAYVAILPSHPAKSTHPVCVKNLRTGDSVWVRILTQSDSIPDVILPGGILEIWQQVLSGVFVSEQPDSQSRFADEFMITAILRDTFIVSNPHPDSLDSLLVPGKTIADFAPLRIGNSWTYLDSTVYCTASTIPSPPACQTTLIETRTISIKDIFMQRDTNFIRLVDGKGAATLCFESGNDIYRVTTDPLHPAEKDCVPLLFHGIAFKDSLASAFSKVDTLGRQTLAFSFKDPLWFSANAPTTIDKLRVAKGIGVLGYNRSSRVTTLPSSGSSTVRSTLIGTKVGN